MPIQRTARMDRGIDLITGCARFWQMVMSLMSRAERSLIRHPRPIPLGRRIARLTPEPFPFAARRLDGIHPD